MTETLEIDDLEDRQLCPDGACIGVIGADGRCRECGRQAEGTGSTATAAASRHAGEGEPQAAGDADDASDDVRDRAPAPDADWQQRELCSDDNCIGVLSAEGFCNTCGQRAR